MLRDTGNERQIEEAARKFSELKDYKDSAEQIGICRYEYPYVVASNLQRSLQEKNLKEAARMFGKISGYKDSFVRAKACKDAYEKERNKRLAKEEQEAAKNWEFSIRGTKLRSEQASLQKELLELEQKLFSGRRRREIEARLAQIEYELKKL